MARVPNDATAFAHRERRMMINVAALYNDPAEIPTHQAWVDGLASALQRGPVGAYVELPRRRGRGRVHDAYPDATWDRLADVKRRYDPTNLFQRNQNVPPGG